MTHSRRTLPIAALFLLLGLFPACFSTPEFFDKGTPDDITRSDAFGPDAQPGEPDASPDVLTDIPPDTGPQGPFGKDAGGPLKDTMLPEVGPLDGGPELPLGPGGQPGSSCQEAEDCTDPPVCADFPNLGKRCAQPCEEVSDCPFYQTNGNKCLKGACVPPQDDTGTGTGTGVATCELDADCESDCAVDECFCSEDGKCAMACETTADCPTDLPVHFICGQTGRCIPKPAASE